jgi:ligand-binding SRPBCC domain-containing protein
MPRFARSIEIAAPIERVFDFHLDPRNIIQIAPPANRPEVLSCTQSPLQVGCRVVVSSVQAGIPVRMEAEVVILDPPYVMQDRQVHGPFHHWVHTHRFEQTSGGTRLTDDIDYSLPLGLGRVMSRLIRRELEITFTFRQDATRRILENDRS